MCFSVDEESGALLEAVKLRLFAYSFQCGQQPEGRENPRGQGCVDKEHAFQFTIFT